MLHAAVTFCVFTAAPMWSLTCGHHAKRLCFIVLPSELARVCGYFYQVYCNKLRQSAGTGCSEWGFLATNSEARRFWVIRKKGRAVHKAGQANLDMLLGTWVTGATASKVLCGMRLILLMCLLNMLEKFVMNLLGMAGYLTSQSVLWSSA